MKDLTATLILSFLLAIMFQLSIDITLFEFYWSLTNPIIISIISCLPLILIQRRKQNEFSTHLVKTLKINFFTLILYMPICFLLSIRWAENLQNFMIKLFGMIPRILASTFTTAIILMGSTVIFAVISYFIGIKLAGVIDSEKV